MSKLTYGEALLKIREHLVRVYSGDPLYRGGAGRKRALAGQVRAAFQTANVALGREYNDLDLGSVKPAQPLRTLPDYSSISAMASMAAAVHRLFGWESGLDWDQVLTSLEGMTATATERHGSVGNGRLYVQDSTIVDDELDIFIRLGSVRMIPDE